MDYTIEPPPQKFTVEPPTESYGQSIVSTTKATIEGAWDKLKSDWEASGPDLSKLKDEQKKSFWDQAKDQFHRNVAAGKTIVDAFQLAVSPISGLIGGAVVDPAAKAIHALHSSITEEQARGGVGTSLMMLGPEAGEGGALAKAAEMRPAAKAPTGEISTAPKGGVHDDIPGITDKHERGFVGPDGKFLSREEAGTKAQAAGMDVPKKLHSEDLNKATAPKFTVEKPPPGPILDLPKEGEKVEATAERVDDSLFRVRQNNMADKVEAKRYLDEAPPEVSDPRLQERLYNEIETQMVNPEAKLSPEAAKAAEYLKPWKDEESNLFENLQSRGLGDLADVALQQKGYVHRVPKGMGHPFDRLDPEQFDQANPITVPGRASLSRETSSIHHRKFWVLEGPDKSRIFQAKPDPDWHPGEQIKGSDGKMYSPKLATTEEIEKATGQKYYKNAMVNTVDNVLRLRRVKRNMDLLDALKPQLMEKDLAIGPNRSSADYPNYIATTLPQFEGWRMDPRIAHVLNDFHGQLLRGSDLAKVFAKINNFVVRAMFMMPSGSIAHGLNISGWFVTGRGWDWIRPQAYRSLAKSATRALKAVSTMNDDELMMLREGSPLVAPSVENENFYEMMLKKAGTEMLRSEKLWGPIAKDLGFSHVKDMVNSIQKFMAKELWRFSDVLTLTRTFELMDRGIPVREAIKQAGDEIPNYRVPSEVMGKRWVAEGIKSPYFLMFGRYTHNVFKIYSKMIKPMLKGSAEEKAAAAGKWMALGVLAYTVHLASLALQKATGNKQATVRAPGPLSRLEAAYDLSQGEKDWISFMSSVITPSPVLDMAHQAYTNKDVFGRNIIEPGASLKGKAIEAGEAAAGEIGPVQAAQQMLKPGGPQQYLMQTFGLKVPTPEQQRGKAVGKRIERKQGAKRERKDPAERALDKMFGD